MIVRRGLPAPTSADQQRFLEAVDHWAETGEWVSPATTATAWREYGPEHPCHRCAQPVYWEFRYGANYRLREPDGQQHDCPAPNQIREIEITPARAEQMARPIRQTTTPPRKAQPLSVEVLRIERANTAPSGTGSR